MGRKGEASVRGGPGDMQGDRSNCSSSSSLMHDDGMSAERLRARVMFDHANVAAGSPTQTEPRRTKIVRSEGVKLLQNDLFTPVNLRNARGGKFASGTRTRLVLRGESTLRVSRNGRLRKFGQVAHPTTRIRSMLNWRSGIASRTNIDISGARAEMIHYVAPPATKNSRKFVT